MAKFLLGEVPPQVVILPFQGRIFILPQVGILRFQGRIFKTLVLRLLVAFVLSAAAVYFNNIGRHGITFFLVKSVFIAYVILQLSILSKLGLETCKL